MKSKYKHVTWHAKRAKWVVQIRGRAVYQHFDREADAAAYVKKLLQAPSSKIVRGDHIASAPSSTTKYKYVSWRPARKRWLAHVPAYTSVGGLKFFQHYASKEAAIKAASKSSGVPRSSMLVGEDQHSGPGNFSVHNARCRKRRLFRVMWHVYSHSGSRQRCTVVPGDLCASLTHYTRSAKMFAADPGLLVCSLRGKEMAWKDAMLRNWKKHQPRNIRGVFSMLQDSLRDMASAKARATTAVWQAHINRNVTHHAGWLPLVQTALPLLAKVDVFRSGVLVLGIMDQYYQFVPFSQKFVKAYESFRKEGSILSTLTPVHTCRQWGAAIARATSDMKSAGLSKHVARAYLWPWLLRSQLYCVIRGAGIERLQDEDDLSVDELSKMNPDMKQNLKHLAEHVCKVSDLFTSVGYDGPPELFSMYCCIFLSDSVHDPELVEQKKRYLIKTRSEFATKWQIPMHPAVLLDTCM